MTNAQKAIISNGVARASALCVLLLMFSILAPLSAQVSSGGGVVGIAPLVGAPDSAPTFWHKFNNSSGNSTATIGDNCTNSNHTMVENGTLNYAIDFNATTTLSNCGTGQDNLRNFSISAWIFADGFGESGVGRILSKTTGSVQSWSFVIASATNRLQMKCATNTSAAGEIFVSDTDAMLPYVGAGVWTHVGVTCTQNAAMDYSAQLYVNGLPITTAILTDSSGTEVDDGAYTINFGSNQNDTNDFDGQVDDGRLWGTSVLTAANFLWIYKGGRQ